MPFPIAAIAGQAAASGPTPINKFTFDDSGARKADTGSAPVTLSNLGTEAYVSHAAGSALDLSGQLMLYKEGYTGLSGKTSGTLKASFNRLTATGNKTMVTVGTKLQLFTYDNSGTIYVRGLYTSSTPTQYTIDSTTTISTNTWYDLKLTFDTTAGLKLYVNGSLEASTAIDAGTSSASVELDLGGYQSGSGYLDDVEIYDSVV